MISDRDLLLSVIQRKREERLFYCAGFAGKAWDKVSEYYGVKDGKEMCSVLGFMDFHGINPSRKADAPVFDYSRYFTDIKIPDGISINPDGVLSLPAADVHFTHLISPLRNIFDLDEIKKFPIFKRKEYYDFSDMKAQAAAGHKKNMVVSSWVGRLFETSWPLRGYENMLADMLAEPETAEYFLDIEHDWNLAYTEAAARAGADILYYGDDVGNQNAMTFSAELWREMYKPRWAKTFAAAKKINKNIALWYHSCGNVTDIIPDLIEIGLDILNPIQPECMDIYAVQKKYGDKISFDGGLGTQRLLPWGTAAEVKKEVENLVNVFGKNGGFILSPAHVIEPEVPIENIKAFVDTARAKCNGK